jgi:hypothetical protein
MEATHTTLAQGTIRMARGRRVFVRVVHVTRHNKQLRIYVRWEETDKRYSGGHVLPKWFRTSSEAIDAVRQRWKATRGGFQVVEV